MEILAVDPDVDCSGIAKFDTDTKAISTNKLRMPQLVDYLRLNARNIKKVIVEGGWLNEKVNFHGGNYAVAQKIANAVGRNAQVGRLIIEFAEYYHIATSTIKPLAKIWRNGKISQEELNNQLRLRGYTPLKRTNQDQRDAIIILLFGI